MTPNARYHMNITSLFFYVRKYWSFGILLYVLYLTSEVIRTVKWTWFKIKGLGCRNIS